jgi:hypothetical protein
MTMFWPSTISRSISSGIGMYGGLTFRPEGRPTFTGIVVSDGADPAPQPTDLSRDVVARLRCDAETVGE